MSKNLDKRPDSDDADWIGKLERRWSWKTFSFRWGRWSYQTDCTGNNTKRWWKWEEAQA